MKYTVLTGRKGVLNSHGFARRKADEEDVYDFQDVMSGEKSRSHKEGRGRGRGESKVLSLSPSQSSLNDIPRPSELGPSIEEQAKLMHAYRIQVPSLPPLPPAPAAIPDSAFAGGGPDFHSLVHPTDIGA